MIPDSTNIQSIDLRVRDLKSSLEFYTDQLGFKIIEKNEKEVFISSDGKYPYMFRLQEDSSATVRLKGTSGLYHIAILFPGRKELAAVFMRLFRNNIKFQGFSDHLVSEAIYLADPDGNGIELYADKPKESWIRKNGEVVMDSLPLDLSVITREMEGSEIPDGLHPDTKLGHIHLNVTDLKKAEEFYNEILGFSISNYSYPGAKFFAAGGYHHHIAANTWMTNKRISRDEKSPGLISYTVKLNDTNYLLKLYDKLKNEGYPVLDSNDKIIKINDPDGNIINIIP